MQFLVESGHVQCPACGLQLKKIGEQDARVHIMTHPVTPICSISDKRVRVDRQSGYGEFQNNA